MIEVKVEKINDDGEWVRREWAERLIMIAISVLSGIGIGIGIGVRFFA